jgi:anti-sigma regulatory factor (Ser/Thr protein kinase)
MDDGVAAPLRLCVRRSMAQPEPAEDGAAPAIVWVGIRVPADVRCVEEAVELMARHCFAGAVPSRRTSFRLRVLLAEALTNSILFGAQGDPNRTVSVSAVLGSGTIRLEVTDDGPGFDPKAVTDPTSPTALSRPVGRGLFLIRNLADQVEFNAQGNTIWMTLPRA